MSQFAAYSAIGEALTKFLKNTKLSANNDYIINIVKPPTDEVKAYNDEVAIFEDSFSDAKKTLCAGIEITAAGEILKKLENEELNQFRLIRATFSKWFVTCQHLELKLNSNSKSRDYM